MLPYAALMALINIAIYGFSNLSVLTSVAAGSLAGIAALFALYRHFSDWHTFLEIVLPFTGIGAASQSKTSGLAVKIFGQAPGDDTLFSCWFGIPTEFLSQKTLFDYSAALLFLLVVVISFIMWHSADKKDRKLILFIVSVTLFIPPAMHFAGHYRSYYRWMTYIPLAIALPRLLEAQCQTSGQNKLHRYFLVVIGISVFLGVPLRTLAILPRWTERSIQPLEKVAANIVQPSDLVVCNFKAYFAIRPYAKLVYAYGLPARGDFSREYDLATNQVTLLCLFSNDLYTVTNVIGGHWKKVPLNHISEAVALTKTRYAMDFYRRDSN